MRPINLYAGQIEECMEVVTSSSLDSREGGNPGNAQPYPPFKYS